MIIRIGTRWIWVIALLGLTIAWGCDTGGNTLVGSGEATSGITISTQEATFAAIESVTMPGATLASEAVSTPETQLAATPQPSDQPQLLPDTVEITPVESFSVTVADSVNIRVGPSTETSIAGSISPGEQKTVIGEVIGEALNTEQGDLWYALEEGGFVYAALVVLDVQ